MSLVVPPHTSRDRARAPQSSSPDIEHDPDVLQSFLSDAAHVPGGTAAGVVFPANVDEVAAIVAAARHILPVGAQSSLTGGATPRGDVVLSTRRLSRIGEPEGGAVRVGAGVPLSELHRFLAARDLFYPPAQPSMARSSAGPLRPTPPARQPSSTASRVTG